MVNLKSTFIQDFIARSSYMTDRLQIIQENFYNSKTSMELHYMLPRWYLVVKMHRCSIVMENILEEYFGAISQIFVYLPLTCYEILRLLVFWHFPNYFRSVGNLIQILLSLRSIFFELGWKAWFGHAWVVSCLSPGHWATLGNQNVVSALSSGCNKD